MIFLRAGVAHVDWFRGLDRDFSKNPNKVRDEDPVTPLERLRNMRDALEELAKLLGSMRSHSVGADASAPVLDALFKRLEDKIEVEGQKKLNDMRELFKVTPMPMPDDEKAGILSSIEQAVKNVQNELISLKHLYYYGEPIGAMTFKEIDAEISKHQRTVNSFYDKVRSWVRNIELRRQPDADVKARGYIDAPEEDEESEETSEGGDSADEIIPMSDQEKAKTEKEVAEAVKSGPLDQGLADKDELAKQQFKEDHGKSASQDPKAFDKWMDATYHRLYLMSKRKNLTEGLRLLKSDMPYAIFHAAIIATRKDFYLGRRAKEAVREKGIIIRLQEKKSLLCIQNVPVLAIRAKSEAQIFNRPKPDKNNKSKDRRNMIEKALAFIASQRTSRAFAKSARIAKRWVPISTQATMRRGPFYFFILWPRSLLHNPDLQTFLQLKNWNFVTSEAQLREIERLGVDETANDEEQEKIKEKMRGDGPKERSVFDAPYKRKKPGRPSGSSSKKKPKLPSFKSRRSR